MIRAFKLALVFLTRIPVPVRFEPAPHDWGRSALCFPLVGLLIGLLLAGLQALLPTTHPGIAAVVLLVVWTLLTGGLHLDGLADTADAWVGGHGDAEKTLTIIKDPCSGPIGVMMVVLVLLAKFAALDAIAADGAWHILLWAPVLGRSAMLFLMLTTPYVRATTGMGAAFAAHLPRLPAVETLVVLTVAFIFTLGAHGLVMTLLLGGALVWLSATLLARIGGYTGDTLGATCEVSEAFVLLTLVLLSG